MLTVKIKRTADLPLPKKAHETDAGFDLYSSENCMVCPGEIKKISCGIKVHVPKGYYAQLRPRSGMASKGLTMSSSGVVDFGYSNEILFSMINLSKNPYQVKVGDKICQMLILPVPLVQFEEVDELEETERGEKGFGSTGA